jgi:hypothetical protein
MFAKMIIHMLSCESWIFSLKFRKTWSAIYLSILNPFFNDLKGYGWHLKDLHTFSLEIREQGQRTTNDEVGKPLIH